MATGRKDRKMAWFKRDKKSIDQATPPGRSPGSAVCIREMPRGLNPSFILSAFTPAQGCKRWPLEEKTAKWLGSSATKSPSIKRHRPAVARGPQSALGRCRGDLTRASFCRPSLPLKGASDGHWKKRPQNGLVQARQKVHRSSDTAGRAPRPHRGLVDPVRELSHYHVPQGSRGQLVCLPQMSIPFQNGFQATSGNAFRWPLDRTRCRDDFHRSAQIRRYQALYFAYQGSPK